MKNNISESMGRNKGEKTHFFVATPPFFLKNSARLRRISSSSASLFGELGRTGGEDVALCFAVSSSLNDHYSSPLQSVKHP